MKRKIGAVALATAALVVLAGCSSTPETNAPDPDEAKGQNITLWLMGGDTPAELRDYLKTEYNEATGGTLTIEEQGWGDAIAKLTTALPDADNTPDVTEIGNTWSGTFTGVGAFSDITDMYEELGGDKLLKGFVDAGKVGDSNYALPYYFGSRYGFYRKDLFAAAGVDVPTTLPQLTEAAQKLRTDATSGFYIGGEDWRNGISWVFAYGGDLAKRDGDTWASSLSDPKTIEGLTALQELYTTASNAPITENDVTTYENLNTQPGADAPEAAATMAPGWAHWSIGDLSQDPEDDSKLIPTWNDEVFGTFVLPGVDGGIAPVFAGGSNIAISKASKNQAGARELMKIIFSEEYQNMLGANGLGPANSDYVGSLGDDQFAKALVESALGSKLTPAAPGWAAVEGSGLLEEFFSKVNGGGDIAALAAEYDQKIDELING